MNQPSVKLTIIILMIFNLCACPMLEIITFGLSLFGPEQFLPILNIVFYILMFPQIILYELGLIDDLSGSLGFRLMNSIVWAFVVCWPWRMVNRLVRGCARQGNTMRSPMC